MSKPDDPTLVGALIERRFLGVVEVDSATLLIGDPAYVLGRSEENRAGLDFQAVIDTPLELNAAAPFANGLALLIGLDDGPYGVFGEYDEGELMRVYIDLDGIALPEDAG